MWLLLRSRRASAALDLDKGRIWSIVNEPLITIDLPDGRLFITFASPAVAAIAAEYLLQAILERKEVIDTSDTGWGEFQAEWQYFDPLSEEQEAEAPSESTENDTEASSWESAAPADPTLRRLWEKAEKVRGVLRPKQADIEQVILETCQGQFFSAEDIGIVLDRSPTSIRVHFLNPLVHSGRLEKKFPEKRNHPRQRYRTAMHQTAK